VPVLEGIVAAVTDTVSGAEDAGVSLWEGKSLRTVAATSDLVEQVNNLEHELNEGPCLDALHMGRTYRIDDMSHERRWPRFAAADSVVHIGLSLQGPSDIAERPRHVYQWILWVGGIPRILWHVKNLPRIGHGCLRGAGIGQAR
jgi:hypothetical protein